MQRFLSNAALLLTAGAVFSPAANAAAPDVKLADQGGTVTLDNGIITAVVDKATARIVSLRYRQTEMEKRGDIYFSMDGGTSYRNPQHCRYSVAASSPRMVDICMLRTWKDEPQAFDIYIHYVLRRGDSGIYAYALLDHPADYPATGYGEWRMVWKLPADLLDWICVDDLRHWPMPSAEDYKTATPTPIKEIVKINAGPRAGQYDCKYDFNASYYDLGCWGHAGSQSKLGAWIVCGGYDFFNDGPTKQDLNAAADLNHIHFGMNHYNGSGLHVAAGEAWRKLFGPWLLYCNHDERGVEALWADAKSRLARETAAWPYSWLTTQPADYPPADQRGSVSGRLVLTDALQPAVSGSDAWVGLAQPEAGGNWQFESRHYQYWTRADSTGRFTVKNIRPGTYTLYAWNTGVIDEFSRGGIVVTSGDDTALGDVEYKVPHTGSRIAWEIGVADRTAREFRGGDSYFHGYRWQEFSQELPNPLEYTIGNSHPARDWNYVHTAYRAGDKVEPWKWRIHFDLDKTFDPARGDAALCIAFASAQRASVQVYVNDETAPVATVTPAVQGGNALLREGIHAKYCHHEVAVPAAKLRAGANTITLVEPAIRGADSHVMYDCLRMELP